MTDVLLLIAGLVVLIIGGEALVRGAVSIAQKLNVSTLIIGMTVVSFGTSAPELIVSIQAATEGNPDIAVGNVVGSNLANLGLVLGLTVILLPMAVDRNSLRFDWPAMIILSFLFCWFAWDGSISRVEGVVLFSLLILFILFLIWNARSSGKVEVDDVPDEKPQNWGISSAYLMAGLAGLYFGAEFLLKGAVGIAESSGMDQRTIGLTIIAFGTSVPELATSVIAARRGQTDISIGNLIGSNIFNIGAVIGITAIIQPITVAEGILSNDLYWMMGVALILLPFMLHMRKLHRWKGVVLLGSYVTYFLVLFLVK